MLLLLLVTAVCIYYINLNAPESDTVAPAIAISNPLSGETVSDTVEISFSATDESYISEYEIWIDTTPTSDMNHYSWNTTTESNGNHTIRCSARDEFGNQGEAKIWVWVSNLQDTNTPPIVTITGPSNGSIVVETVTISVDVSDEDSIIPTISIDGTPVATAFLYHWDTTAYPNGTHAIEAEATDSEGLTGFDIIHVIVDNPVAGPSPTYADAIKVLTYNIEASGADPNWKEVFKEENPDIAILVETGTWDDASNEILNSVVDEFNAYFTGEYPYVGYCAQGVSYSTSGEAILSRFPILEFNQIGLVTLDDASSYDVTHDFIHAVVNISGTEVHILGAHLKAMGGETNEDRRERETEGIINYMDNLGEVPIMYMGDLNSFSPDDTGDLAPLGDLGYGPLTMMLYPDDLVYGQYASTLHNFTDVFRTLNPADPGYTYGHQDPSYLSRIDFIIANSYFDNYILNSTCGDSPTADLGSDHYAVDVFIHWNLTSDAISPSQVAGLEATVISSSQIGLVWSANPEPDIAHYVVYRNDSILTTTSNIFYIDAGLNSSTAYSYEVAAKDFSGNEGPRSAPANATTLEATPAEAVVLNEFLPDPDVLYSEEWIELYNPSDEEANLTGYILDDLVGGGGSPYTIPLGVIIPAGGFLVFNQSTVVFMMNNDGDTVNLIMPDGITVQDSHTYSSSSNDVSYGRNPDGAGAWTTFAAPTPGASNTGLLLHPPVSDIPVQLETFLLPHLPLVSGLSKREMG